MNFKEEFKDLKKSMWRLGYAINLLFGLVVWSIITIQLFYTGWYVWPLMVYSIGFGWLFYLHLQGNEYKFLVWLMNGNDAILKEAPKNLSARFINKMVGKE